MEATDGLELELSNGDLEKGSMANMLGSNGNIDNKITKNGMGELQKNETEALQTDEILEVQLQARDANGSELAFEDSSVISENKISTLFMKARTDQSNNLEITKAQKLKKNGAGMNDAAVNYKNPKARLSQSISLPAKSYHACAPRKSATAAKQTNVDGNSLSANNSEFASSGGLTANKSRSNVMGSTQKSLPVNTGSVDDYASSIATNHASHTTAERRSASGFTFRLDERAEKRKEFFMKLEEKVHAKELEKTNMQAKSIENQEAEIRQLRKSLAFKATPMPSFYQEPIPPKVELKKIPPTRARSPKLGRHKPSSTTANISEVNDSTQRSETDPKVIKQNMGAETDAVAPKRTIHKSHPRLPSLKSVVNKPEPKLAGSKSMNKDIDKSKVEENEMKPAGETHIETFTEVARKASDSPAEIECRLIASESRMTNPTEVPIKALQI